MKKNKILIRFFTRFCTRLSNLVQLRVGMEYLLGGGDVCSDSLNLEGTHKSI